MSLPHDGLIDFDAEVIDSEGARDMPHISVTVKCVRNLRHMLAFERGGWSLGKRRGLPRNGILYNSDHRGSSLKHDSQMCLWRLSDGIG
jgi:hypothetical protein